MCALHDPCVTWSTQIVPMGRGNRLEREKEKNAKPDCIRLSRLNAVSSRGLANHTVHGFGEVIQVMCVETSHGDTAILGL